MCAILPGVDIDAVLACALSVGLHVDADAIMTAAAAAGECDPMRIVERLLVTGASPSG